MLEIRSWKGMSQKNLYMHICQVVLLYIEEATKIQG